MAGKPIDGDLVVLSETAPPSHPTPPEPSAAHPAVPKLDEATLSQIEGLVLRATKSRAWASAQDYFKGRFQGEVLAYALTELDRAQQETLSAAQAA